MDFAALLAAALVVAPAAGPECGAAGLPEINRAARTVVEELLHGVTARGETPPDLFAPGLADQLRADQRSGAARRLDQDWLSGGGDISAVTDVQLNSLNRTGVDDIVMGLAFTNAEGEAMYRRIHLGCHDGRWRVEDVDLHPESVSLRSLLGPRP